MRIFHPLGVQWSSPRNGSPKPNRCLDVSCDVEADRTTIGIHHATNEETGLRSLWVNEVPPVLKKKSYTWSKLSFCPNTSKHGCNSDMRFLVLHSLQQIPLKRQVRMEKHRTHTCRTSWETNTSLNVLMTQPLIPQKILKQTKISPQFQQNFKVSLFFLVSKIQPLSNFISKALREIPRSDLLEEGVV